MGSIASQITSPTIVYAIVYSDADQRKYESSASLAFVRGIHRGPVNSPHKWPVTRKMFPFDDVIMHIIEGIKNSNPYTVPIRGSKRCAFAMFLHPITTITLRWRHNDHAGVSNHQPHGCLLNRLFRRKSKKTSKLRVTGLCAGNSPGTGILWPQNDVENVPLWTLDISRSNLNGLFNTKQKQYPL